MRSALLPVIAALLVSSTSVAQLPAGVPVQVRVVSVDPARRELRPAVVWLDPIEGRIPFPPGSHHTLLQKDRTFIPHVQVIPVGSVVEFPNADPFFHNVFSLYEGKRFDLGLYEAGSSKAVTFARPGVSYIFCNIHPEMSAVIIALTSPLYVITTLSVASSIPSVQPGDYALHLWIEGVPQSALETLDRRIHVGSAPLDVGTIPVSISGHPTAPHLNKFGKPYNVPREDRYP